MTLEMQLTKSVVSEHVGREGQLYQQSESLMVQQTTTLLGCPSLPGSQKLGHRNSPSLVVDG